MLYKLPLVLTPQPKGGYTITSPLLPELVTEGYSLDEALPNVRDAPFAVIEASHDPSVARYPRTRRSPTPAAPCGWKR